MNLMVALLSVFQLRYIISIISIPISQPKENKFESFLEYGISINNYSIPSIQIQFGSHLQQCSLYLSTLDNKLYISDYKYEDSITYSSDNNILMLDYIQQNLEGKISFDTLNIGNIQLKTFPFISLISRMKKTSFEGFIGLGYNFPKDNNQTTNETDFSLLYQLKKRNIIDKYIVSISKNANQPVMLIGEYPQFPPITNQFNYKTCPLIEFNTNGAPNTVWQCLLHSIYFKDGLLFPVKQRMSISLGGNLIGVSKEFFDLIVDRYFFYDLNNGDCKYSNSIIYCFPSCSVMRSSLEINLVLGKWTLKIKNKDLFHPNANFGNFFFVIKTSASISGGQWTLGTSILKDIQPVLDGEKDQFGLYFTNTTLT